MMNIRSDAAKYEVYKKKERERWAKRKEDVKPKTARELRMQRKKWHESKQRQKMLRAAREESVADLTNVSAVSKSCSPLTLQSSMSGPLTSTPNTSIQKQRGRKKVRRDRSKACKEIGRLKNVATSRTNQQRTMEEACTAKQSSQCTQIDAEKQNNAHDRQSKCYQHRSKNSIISQCNVQLFCARSINVQRQTRTSMLSITCSLLGF